MKTILAILWSVLVLGCIAYFASWPGHFSRVQLIYFILPVLLLISALHRFQAYRRQINSTRSRQQYYKNQIDLEELYQQPLEIHLAPSSHGWRSEPILLAAGAFMEALGYDYAPENEESAAAQRAR